MAGEWYTKTELTVPPAAADTLFISDVSDTTETSQGTVKRVTVANLLAGAGDTGPVSASGPLTRALHGGRVVITTGSVTIPNAAGDVGMRGQIIIGSAGHTVTFNSTVTAALGAGDVFSYYVQSATVLKRALLPSANQPAMS